MAITSFTDTDSITFLSGASRISEIVGGINTLTLNGTASNFVEILRIADPTGDNSAANKKYVDEALATGGGSWKNSVRAATTSNGTLATAYANGQVVDGVTLATGNRILLKNQSIGVDNGIYIVNASGAPTRADGALAGASVSGIAVAVRQGNSNAGRVFICTNNIGNDVVGANSLTFISDTKNWIFTGSNAGIQGATSLIQLASSQVTMGTNLKLGDNNTLRIGTGNDLSISHDGTNTTMTSTTGNLLIDNTSATGATSIQLGTDTAATVFNVLNDSGGTLFSVNGAGGVFPGGFSAGNWVFTGNNAGLLADDDLIQLASGNVTLGGDLTVPQSVTIGPLVVSHGGSNASILNSTGPTVIGAAGDNDLLTLSTDLVTIQGSTSLSSQLRLGTGTSTLEQSGGINFLLQNTEATGTILVRLGTATSATSFNVQNSGASNVFTVRADGTGVLTGNLDVQGGLDVTGTTLTTAAGITNTAGEVLVSGGNVRLSDNIQIGLGTGNDLSVVHNGTNTTITSTTGNLIIDNTNTTGSTQLQTGTDTSATAVQVINNSGTIAMSISGSRQARFDGRMFYNRSALTIGGNNHNWTPAELLNGFAIRTNTSNSEDVLPTGTALINAIDGCVVGTSFDVRCIAAGNRYDLNNNTGANVNGNVRVVGASIYTVIVTSLSPATYEMYLVSRVTDNAAGY